MKKILHAVAMYAAVAMLPAAAQDAARPSAADVLAHDQAIAKALAAATPVKAAVEEYRLRNNAYPSSNADIGLNPPATYRTNDIKAIAVGSNGRVEITLTASSGVDDGVIRFTPKPTQSSDQGTVEWTCASASYSSISDASGGVCDYTNQP